MSVYCIDKRVIPTAEPVYEPPWLRLARFELGVREIDGPKSNARIDGYHAHTAAGVPGKNGDATSWCSSFVCAMMERSGVPSTRSKSARSWLRWGKELAEPQLGCVAVLWRVSRSSAFGHVGLFVGFDDQGRVLLLGGNQNQAVSVRPYQKSRVLSYRWPDVP